MSPVDRAEPGEGCVDALGLADVETIWEREEELLFLRRADRADKQHDCLVGCASVGEVSLDDAVAQRSFGSQWLRRQGQG